jgi:hypothetical protein
MAKPIVRIRAGSSKSDFGKVFAAMSRITAKASEDDLKDLEDALDIDAPARDNWNGSDRNVENNPTGSEERMSGGGGAEMVNRYSDPTPQSSAAAYDEFSARLDGVEEAVKSIAKFIEASIKGGNLPFPKNDAERFTSKAEDEDASEEDEREDDSASEKSMRSFSVPKLMQHLSSLSKGSNKSGLQPAPDFGASLVKGGPDVSAVLASEIEHMPLHDAITCKSLYMKMKAGHMDLATRALASASDNVKTAFAKAGLVARSEMQVSLKRI